MLVLIQPGAVLQKATFATFTAAVRKTPRILQAYRLPESIQPGIVFPEYVVFPYQITMTFLTVTPLSIIPGVLFYALASLVFKHQFVYSYAVPNESGGEYWRKLSIHLLAGLLMNQIFTVVQFAHDRRAIIPTLLMLLLIGLTCAFIPFLRGTFDPICAHLPLTGEDRKKKRRIAEDLVHKQTHLLQVLQPIETAPLVFARIDAEGDVVEGFEMFAGGSAVQIVVINGKSEAADELISSPSETILSLKSKDPNTPNIRNTPNAPNTPSSTNTPNSANSTNSTNTTNTTTTPNTQIPSTQVPMIHHSSSTEDRLYEVIPLPLNDPLTAATFDTFDVDHLTDRRHLKLPYGHPCMLEHEQALMVPSKLPALMKIFTQGSAEEDEKPSEQSPIVMGESALGEI
jgi:hypothetical protein